MRAQEHIETVHDFLEESDREFSEGKDLQASEKLWGAASYAVMAVAQQRGWPYGSHRAIKTAADRLGELHDDSVLSNGFGVAEKFHANFYHGFMEDYQLDADRPKVKDFVHRVIALLPQNGASSE